MGIDYTTCYVSFMIGFVARIIMRIAVFKNQYYVGYYVFLVTCLSIEADIIYKLALAETPMKRGRCMLNQAYHLILAHL